MKPLDLPLPVAHTNHYAEGAGCMKNDNGLSKDVVDIYVKPLALGVYYRLFQSSKVKSPYELSREKTNNVVSEQIRHKSGCTVTEAG